jgi:hypothetical protein
MSTNWAPSNEAARKERFWRTAPQDPTKLHKQHGVPYFRPGHDRVLMPSSFMPVGEHAGKQMQAVSASYLVWVDDQPWSRQWVGWAPVTDFIDRFIRSDAETLAAIDFPYPRFYLTELAPPKPSDPQIPAFRAGIARLYTDPGHANEDLLHAFAVGCLHLRTNTYHRGAPPYYDVTVGKHCSALRNGAQLATFQQQRSSAGEWRNHFAK